MSSASTSTTMHAGYVTRSISETTLHQCEVEPRDLERSTVNHNTDVAIIIPELEDPNVVDWDGPEDPDNPLNWPVSRKWINVAVLSANSFLTPFASSTFAPGVPLVMEEFNEESMSLASFVVSVYVLGYVFGPLVIAPASELYGRLPVYHINTFLFLVFTVGCARSNSMTMLILFRFLSGLAGSCAITVGSGTIADAFKQEERGMVMSLWSFPIIFAPSLGPVVGSYLSEAGGWRWDFYLLVICTVVLMVVMAIFQRETYPPVLLERKVKRLRMETGNQQLRSALQSTKTSRGLFLLSITRPLKMLCLSPIIFGTSLYIAVTYGYLYLLYTTFTFVFQDTYGISPRDVGLVFLGISLGQLIALAVFSHFSDRLLKTWANGGELKPELRLPLLWPGAFLIPAGLFIYGWSAQYGIHWIVPIMGTFVFGAGIIIIYMSIGTYLVDAYTTYAASAMAANTVFRSIGGALLPMAGRDMYHALGLGWGNSLLALIAIGMTPMIWVFCKYGEWLRQHPRFKLNL